MPHSLRHQQSLGSRHVPRILMQFPRLDYAKKSNLGVVNTFIAPNFHESGVFNKLMCFEVVAN